MFNKFKSAIYNVVGSFDTGEAGALGPGVTSGLPPQSLAGIPPNPVTGAFRDKVGLCNC